MWLCKCDCEEEKYTVVRSADLTRGATKSCGCIHKEMVGNLNRRHGDTGNRFYKIWQDMIARCTNVNEKSYCNYGGRGITICDKWRKDYLNFKEDMYENYLKHTEEFGEKDTTIDRIDVNGNYEPSNCKWSTKKEQANNKRSNIFITVGELTKTIQGWTEYLGVSEETIRWRVKNKNMTHEEAVLDLMNMKRRKKNNEKITLDDITKTPSQWCKTFDICYKSVQGRVKVKKQTYEEAIEYYMNKKNKSIYNFKKEMEVNGENK